MYSKKKNPGPFLLFKLKLFYTFYAIFALQQTISFHIIAHVKDTFSWVMNSTVTVPQSPLKFQSSYFMHLY